MPSDDEFPEKCPNMCTCVIKIGGKYISCKKTCTYLIKHTNECLCELRMDAVEDKPLTNAAENKPLTKKSEAASSSEDFVEVEKVHKVKVEPPPAPSRPGAGVARRC